MLGGSWGYLGRILEDLRGILGDLGGINMQVRSKIDHAEFMLQAASWLGRRPSRVPRSRVP